MANLTQNAADCQNLCIYSKFFVKNRELRPDKSKFTFTHGKLTMELDEIR